jgi:hypothetical protein
VIVDRWNLKTDLEARLTDLKHRFTSDCQDADRVVRFELRTGSGFWFWLKGHPLVDALLLERIRQEVGSRRISIQPVHLTLCDDVRVVSRHTIVGDLASLMAVLDTGREIKIATIGCP